MDYFSGLREQIRAYLVFVILLENLLLIGTIWVAVEHLHLPLGPVALSAYGVSIVMTFIITFAAADYAMQPLEAIWRGVIKITSHSKHIAEPEFSKLVVGRVLVTRLMEQIYKVVADAEHPLDPASSKVADLQSNFIANNLPLPLFILDAKRNIVFANHAAGEYIGQPAADIIQKEAATILHMTFPSEDTLSSWLAGVSETAITATNTWERVRLDITDNRPMRLFDMAAYYNKDNSESFETLLVLFDHTKRYSQDDQAISFMALSVHELRTPLTLLRGYIEALEEETRGKLDPELDGFLIKMNATAQQMMAYVSTMLNVARVDNDQLVLKLHEENWGDVVKATVDMMSLRAQVRGITLRLSIADGLPTVGCDRTSIQEVITNLIDNAIKYSGSSKEISISAYLNGEGMVETAVQDAGVGVPASVLPHLFTKFYRDHRNRAQIGGTGLGLYLCKAVVTAHGGNIWVKSKEGKGSTFSFTVVPYNELTEDARNGDNKDITLNHHGWIKNHSLYRR